MDSRKVSPATKVALFYCVLAIAWIVGSDLLTHALVGDDPERLLGVQTFKGLLFIGVMTVALYVLVARLHQAEQRNRQMEAMLGVSRRLETVGGLAATLIHDLNNMLAVIRGFTDLAMVEQGRAGGVASGRLADIDAAVVRANAMVRQLSSFLHRQPDGTESADVGEVVRELEPLLQQAATREVHLQAEVEPDLPCMPLNRTNLEQALLNLVMNARDAMEHEAERRLAITVSRVDLHRHVSVHQPKEVSGEFVRIRVQDTGCGIPPGDIVAIFTPFFTTKPPGRGTGLGLASVLRTAQQHGGWVEVKSRPGRGATFDVYLPVLPPVPGRSDR